MTTKRLLLALTISLVAALSIGAASASAWNYHSRAGSPGAVTSAPAAAFQDVTHHYAWGASPMPMVTMNGPTANRSPATRGSQDMFVRYALERWTGSQWVEEMLRSSHVRIGPQHSWARFANLVLYPRNILGTYRVTQSFHWFVAGTQRKIGASLILPTGNDMQCATSRCLQYNGYVQIGRPGTSYRSSGTQAAAAAPETGAAAPQRGFANPRAH